jgi:hypothetical protein
MAEPEQLNSDELEELKQFNKEFEQLMDACSRAAKDSMPFQSEQTPSTPVLTTSFPTAPSLGNKRPASSSLWSPPSSKRLKTNHSGDTVGAARRTFVPSWRVVRTDNSRVSRNHRRMIRAMQVACSCRTTRRHHVQTKVTTTRLGA